MARYGGCQFFFTGLWFRFDLVDPSIFAKDRDIHRIKVNLVQVVSSAACRYYDTLYIRTVWNSFPTLDSAALLFFSRSLSLSEAWLIPFVGVDCDGFCFTPIVIVYQLRENMNKGKRKKRWKPVIGIDRRRGSKFSWLEKRRGACDGTKFCVSFSTLLKSKWHP